MNYQTIPKEARHLFVASVGSVLLEADYSNLELRVLAYLSNDQPMIATFQEGKNIHDENCKDLFGIDKQDKTWDLARRAAKIFVFGRNYGGGLRGIYERVAKEVPELGLTFARFCEVDERYRQRHPAYTGWAEEIERSCLATRSVTNAFGRKRILLGTDAEIVREGLNTPIQGTAADIINKAMIGVYKDFSSLRPTPYILLQVHDSLLVECKTTQKKAVTKILEEHMQAEYQIGSHLVRFPVEIKDGKNWKEMK